MAEDDSFKDSIKLSFQKARKHAESIEKELNELKLAIKKQNSDIITIKREFQPSSQAILDDFSIGNEGVQAINQSSKHQASTKQALSNQSSNQNISEFQTFELKGVPENISKPFKILTKREFMAFLTIYQLEDEKGFATYQTIAERMELTPSCIRGYISSAIRKGSQILKQKPNNQSVILRIKPSFRELELKQRLINIFYKKDPDQLTLTSKISPN